MSRGCRSCSLRTMLTRHLESAKKKAEEWADTPVVAKTYRMQVYRIEAELEGLKCSCEADEVVEEIC